VVLCNLFDNQPCQYASRDQVKIPCCSHCKKFNTCSDRCENSPDKCGYSKNDQKHICKLDKLTWEVLSVYENIKQASEKTSIGIDSIRKVLQGKYKTAGGYRWRYEDEEI
jgi:hypothetical protein